MASCCIRLHTDEDALLLTDALKGTTDAAVEISEELTPFGALLAVRELRRFRAENPQAAIEYAGSDLLGIRAAVSGEAAAPSGSVLPVFRADLYALHREALAHGELLEMGDAIERYSGTLAGTLFPNDAESRALLTYLLRELLRNVPEHAGCGEAWLCARRRGPRVCAAVLDEGRGIRSSLCSNAAHRRNIQTDEDALSWAVKAGISKAFRPGGRNPSDDPWANSGFGLFMTSRISLSLGGSFRLLSGGRCLAMESGETRLDKACLSGTAVGLTACMEEIGSSRARIARAADEGEAEARALRAAFRKASLPSRGLMGERAQRKPD